MPVNSVIREAVGEVARAPGGFCRVGSEAPSTATPVPDDPALPGLALLRHPEQLVMELTPLFRQRLGSRIELTHKRLSIRRYVPRLRCVVKFEGSIRAASEIGSEDHCFLAKFYSREQGARVYKNCQELWRHGFSQGRFTIAEPLAYYPTWQVLVLGWENGPSLRDIVLAGRDALPAMEGAAKWLRRLHTCGFQGGRAYSFSRQLQVLEARKRSLSSIHQGAGRVFGRILDHMKHRFLKLDAPVWAPTHRDFSPEHVIVEGQRFVGLDFDEFCQYDPLFDVAHFVAHLRFLALTSLGAINSLDALAARFEDSYAAAAPDFSAARLRLFSALAYLKLIYLEALVRHNRDGRHVLDTLFEEAGRFAESRD